MKNELAEVKRFYENKTETLREEYNSKHHLIELNLQKVTDESASKIELLEKALENEKYQNEQYIQELKSGFETALANEKAIHAEEINKLREEMYNAVLELKEELKSPMQKLAERYLKKGGK